MKNLVNFSSILILFFSLSFQNVLQCQSKSTYPDLDRALLNLWFDCDKSNQEQIKKSLDKLTTIWGNSRKKVSKQYVDQYDMNLFSKDLDQLLHVMESTFKQGKYSQLKSYAYHFMWEFRSIRQCSFNEDYPLDHLFNVYELYKEIHYTVDDPLFGLREWSDFEDLVNIMICDFETYDLIHDNAINSYFAGLNNEDHKQSKAKAANCINNLLLSFDSGYQPNFKIPCDELGDALIELFQVYAKAIPVPNMEKGVM